MTNLFLRRTDHLLFFFDFSGGFGFLGRWFAKSAVPSGLVCRVGADSQDFVLGYFRLSLRDVLRVLSAFCCRGNSRSFDFAQDDNF
jgi:hypothetical protein